MQDTSQGTDSGSCCLVDYSSSDADSYVSPLVLEDDNDVRSLVTLISGTHQVAHTHRDVHDFSDWYFSDRGNESDAVENVSESLSPSEVEEQGEDETARGIRIYSKCAHGKGKD